MKYNIAEFEYRRLGFAEVDEIMQLQDEVYEKLNNKNLLRKNTREMFVSCVEEPNVSLGVYYENMLIAVGIMVDARGTDEDLGINLEQFTVDKNANMKNVMVSPQFRGNGLQTKLMTELEKIAKERGFTDLCASVSPENKYSLDNALSMGYQIDHQAVKYDGLVRLILVKKCI